MFMYKKNAWRRAVERRFAVEFFENFFALAGGRPNPRFGPRRWFFWSGRRPMLN